MRRVFEEELESLHAHFLKMGVLVNAAIHKSIDAFCNARQGTGAASHR